MLLENSDSAEKDNVDDVDEDVVADGCEVLCCGWLLGGTDAPDTEGFMAGEADFVTIVGVLIEGLLPNGQGGAIVGFGCDRLEEGSDGANALG